MRKRTFLDKKFSQGDSNSEAFRANWDATFGEKEEYVSQCSDCGAEGLHFCTFAFCPTEPEEPSDSSSTPETE